MRPITMKTRSLNALAEFLGIDPLPADVNISGVSSDTRDLDEGDLFLALPGSRVHGASFTADAISQGAVAIVTDQAGAVLSMGLPTLIIADPRSRAGEIAAWIYDYPFRSLSAVGITGTNGKTTTSSLLHQLWSLEGRNTGILGTVGVSIGQENFATRFTTPEATALQAFAAMMVERHLNYFVMEVSSHALAQSRVRSAHFTAAAFTNLTQDHLDFHGTMEQYFLAKAKLFTPEYADIGFINIDGEYGEHLAQMCEIPTVLISRSQKKADWHYTSITRVERGYEVAIRGSGGILIEGYLPLIGEHNLDNAIMAIALAVHTGIDPISISANLRNVRSVAGRLESISLGQNFTALVDFAHSPDAVTRVLTTLRSGLAGKLIAVLGCGGDRDRTKRPIMGKALRELSDVAIFTSDNPRSEDPESILREMIGDIELGESALAIPDRSQAIATAVALAEKGDLVVILGKGHETGQEINGVKYPFDDRVELSRGIEAKS